MGSRPPILSRFQSALLNEQPVTTLRREAEMRLEAGDGVNKVWIELAQLRAELERTLRRYEEEAVAEVMDMLEGWCPPRLYVRPPD
jgi:hypothetical protein